MIVAQVGKNGTTKKKTMMVDAVLVEYLSNFNGL